jgi:adenylate cyclase class 2
VVVSYEKYRTTYELEGVEVTLDELPYGNFCEVEGPDAESILKAANLLKLNWDKRIMDSYLGLFATLNASHGLEIHDLTFANLDGMSFMPEDLGVHPADLY